MIFYCELKYSYIKSLFTLQWPPNKCTSRTNYALKLQKHKKDTFSITCIEDNKNIFLPS